ncbi:MAG: endonuclease Q family protein [Pelosinus sp.]|nr:endonuclease Q family protein [Pelosinus sp.]
MQHFFADLHIHVGKSESGKWIKIPTSGRLTLRNILEEAKNRKGMHIIGIVDALSPLVIADIEQLCQEGLLELTASGGYQYKKAITLLLGAEIETVEQGGGLAHTLIFLPDISHIKSFSDTMKKYIRNINLSSQNAHIPLKKLIQIAAGFHPIIIPAHVFTPFKGLFGACTDRLSHLLSDKELSSISAIELGLSADTFLADRLAELAPFSFVTNSDAHSLGKIAREYNILRLAEASFAECKLAFARKQARLVAANYGLDPHLGKYHCTMCLECDRVFTADVFSKTSKICPYCNSKKIIKGVYDRINEIADYEESVHPSYRPPYHYQIPLEFVPGVGKKVLAKLLNAFGTEMNILHAAAKADIANLIGEKLASEIDKARSGGAAIEAGGGGVYGRIIKGR